MANEALLMVIVYHYYYPIKRQKSYNSAKLVSRLTLAYILLFIEWIIVLGPAGINELLIEFKLPMT